MKRWIEIFLTQTAGPDLRTRQCSRVAEYQVTNQHRGTFVQQTAFKNYTERDGYYM